MKKDLYNYNIGHKPFSYIHGGALETTDEGDYIYDENDDDDNVYLPNGRPSSDWYERDGDNFIMHSEFDRDDYVLRYNPETKTFDYDPPEGETMDIINVSHSKLPYLNYDEEDEDDEDENEFSKAKDVKKVIDDRLDDIKGEDTFSLLENIGGIIETLKEILADNIEIFKNTVEEVKIMDAEIAKDKKRTLIKLKLEETQNPSKLQHEIIEYEKIMDGLTKNISTLNYEDSKINNKGVEKIKDIDKEQKLKMFSIIGQRGTSKYYKTEKELVKAKFMVNILLDSIYPSYKIKNDIMDEYKNEIAEINEQYQEMVLKYNKLKKSYEKELAQASKQESQKSVNEQRKISKLSKEQKLEQEIEERKIRQVEEAKLAQPIEPIEEPISKAKAKKNKAKAKDKKSDEDKDYDVIKNYAQDRIQRIDPSFTGDGKALETFFTGLGESIIQYVTHDKSKVNDNEFNELIPADKTVVFDDGSTGNLRKAVTIDLYNNTHAIEIKNYKHYNINTGDNDGNTDSSGDPIIPLQFSKYEGTKYFRPLYFSDGSLYNIELVLYDDKNEITSRSFIFPENTEGRNLVTIYRLDDGLYKFDPKEHKNITMHFNPIKGLKTSQDKQLYSFSSMNLKPCKDHNGRASFNVRKYLTKIKI